MTEVSSLPDLKRCGATGAAADRLDESPDDRRPRFGTGGRKLTPNGPAVLVRE
ncbi:hypothetical protein [Streptomyces misionensis]|uniref:hypothetical protein n=1 Tax=Streptomyces misionensis TaxID=67331 RepID=UPI003691E143